MSALDEFVKESLPTTLSRAVAGVTLSSALASVFLPEFLQKIGMNMAGTETLSFRISVVSTVLWVGTLFTLAIVVRHFGSNQKKPTHTSFLLEDGDLKWKVTDNKNGTCSVDEIPYCKNHNLKFMQTPAGQYMCPETIGSKCISGVLSGDDVLFLLSMVKSKAELRVCNYETKP